jgi:nucleotide-binding universal stress UspA family protein
VTESVEASASAPAQAAAGHRPHLVVGIDGSNDANLALAWAAGEAVLRDADLWVVHVWSLPHPDSPAAMPPMGLPPLVGEEDGERHARDLLEATVDGVLNGVERRPEVVEPILVQGHAVEALTDVARGAELLVVGSRGRGGFHGLQLGSISQQLAHHAPCPLVIVRATDR